MLRLSRVLLVSALVLALCAPMAMATTSRVIALASAHNYLNDDSNIFRWYGTLPSYANMVYVAGGQASGFGDVSANYQALGFTYSRGEESSWGTFAIFLLHQDLNDMSFFVFNPLINFANDGFPGVGGGGSTLPSLPTTKLVLAWGKSWGDWDIGVMFTNSNVSMETPTTGKNDVKFTTIGGGARWDINPDHYADVNLTFGFAGGDSLGGFDKSSSWDIAARLFREQMADLTIVPYFGYRTYDFSMTDPAEPTGNKGWGMDLGVSLNWDVNANNLLIFVTELMWANAKYSRPGTDQTEVSASVIPNFRIALETDINSWLTTRVGAQKTLAKITQKDATGAESIYTDVNVWPAGVSAGLDNFAFDLGAGFHVGEWDVDLVFSDDLPFRLGYWMTGFGTNDLTPPTTRISGTYRF